MNEKSCLALSHCVRLLSAADARAVGWGLAYLLSALHFFCMVLSSQGPLPSELSSSEHQAFKNTNWPAATNSQRERSRELRGIAFSLGYNGFCLHERVHFFWRAVHFFLIKRNWFSDRIYDSISDKPTDLHTYIQMTEAWYSQRSWFPFETIKQLKHSDHQRERKVENAPKQSIAKAQSGNTRGSLGE